MTDKLIPSEATTAEAERPARIIEERKCPLCGADYSIDGPYRVYFTCGTSMSPLRKSFSPERGDRESAQCLRNQLLTAEARNADLARQLMDAAEERAKTVRFEDLYVKARHEIGDLVRVLEMCQPVVQQFTRDATGVGLAEAVEVALSSAPTNPYADVVEKARALAVALHEHNENAHKRYHIEVLGREGEIADDEGNCCDICCEVGDLLYDLGQALGAIGIDDLSKIPDIRDLAKFPPEQRSEAIRRINDAQRPGDSSA